MNRGVLQMIGATLAFTIMVGLIKTVSDEASSFELVFWRSVFGVAIMGWLARRTGYRVVAHRWLALRVVFGFCAMVCFFTAAQRLSIAEVTLLHKLQPLIIAVAAPWLLGAGERSDRRLWIFLALGLTGCVLLVAPGALAGSWWALWGVGAALFSSVAHMALRGLGPTDDPRVVVFWFMLFSGSMAYVAASLWDGRLVDLPEPWMWPSLVGIGLAASAGQLLMTRAYRAERAAAVSAVGYTGPLFAVVGDAVFFATWPGPLGWLGGALVLAAGLGLVLWRDQARPEAAAPERA